MKARIKTTGEIVDVYESCNEDFPWTDEMGDKVWKTEELIFLETTENNPDYWTRLEHQYAGMAMQSLIMTSTHNFGTSEQIAMWANEYATALVKELKEER